MYVMYLFGYIFSFGGLHLNIAPENFCYFFCLFFLIFESTDTWLIRRISVLSLSGIITFCTQL